MVDAIASLASMPFEMDAWGVDVAVAGSQKGLMTPPGLSFVAASRGRAVHRTAGLRTRYWDWTEREGEQHYQKYCGTPPEHLLFGLRKALDLLFEEGLEKACFRRHRLLAEAVRRAVAVWAEGGVLELQHHEPSERADSVTTVLMAGAHDPRPSSSTARGNAASCWASGSARCTARRFASPTWATSTRR